MFLNTRRSLRALGWGRDTFDRDLVDADWALNNGNWMWLVFRLLLPILSSVRSALIRQKYDKEGVYVKHYIPALRNMPAKYVYEPWLAPLDVQQKVGCVVGADYPARRRPRRREQGVRRQDRHRVRRAQEANTATGKKRKADA